MTLVSEAPLVSDFAPPLTSELGSMRVVSMSRADYEKLPEWPKAEWANGKAYIDMAPVAFEHGDAVGQLIILLGTSLSGVSVVPEVGFRMSDSDRGPDIMVIPKGSASGSWVTKPPLLIAEVISRSTRCIDYSVKSVEYVRAGVPLYLIVDPQIRVISILENDGKNSWNLVTELNAENPTASFEIPGHGTVALDIDQIL